MRKTRTLALSIVLLSTLFIASSCSQDNFTRYTVSFDSLGGSSVAPITVIEGNPIARPATPTYEGYFFSGWYKESTLESIWDFDLDRVISDITLYASWTPEIVIEPTASLTYEEETEGYVVTGAGEEVEIVVPRTYNDKPVIAIGESAFARSAITSIILPDSIQEIRLNAFNNASSLETVTISANSHLTSIANNAFSGNSNLTSFYFPKDLTTLGDSVFNNCGSINSFTVHEENTRFQALGGHLVDRNTSSIIRGSNNPVIPEGVISLESAAFRRSKLEQISIPSTLTTIGNYALNDCNSLKEITVSENNPNYSSYEGVLYNKDQTEITLVPLAIEGTLSLPSSLTTISSSVFNNRASLQNLFIPHGSLTSIGFQAFNRTTLHIYYGGSETQWEAISKNRNWGGNDLEITFNATLNSIPTANSTLIVYFSWSSNTEGVAQQIATKTGGDIVEIIPQTPYTTNYDDLLSVARNELSSNARPEISEETLSNIDIDDYSTVFIGYPIWHGVEPMIIRSFIDEYEGLADKTVYPFSTSSSSGGASAYNNIRTQCSEASVPSYLHLNRTTLSNSETLVNNWIDGMTA